jgi:hypothetical protein
MSQKTIISVVTTVRTSCLKWMKSCEAGMCFTCSKFVSYNLIGILDSGAMLQARRMQVTFPVRSENFFNLTNTSSPGVYAASNRNEYQIIFLGGRVQLVSLADNLTAICEPTVLKMWGPRHLTTLLASKACYRDSFIFFYFHKLKVVTHRSQWWTISFDWISSYLTMFEL